MLADGLREVRRRRVRRARRSSSRPRSRKGFKDKADQVQRDEVPRVHATACENKYHDCRAEFIKIYDVDPDFDLTPAEAGHPSWTKTFAAAKVQAQKALKDKEAERPRSAATAPAAVPAKP